MNQRIFLEGGVFNDEPKLLFDTDPSMSHHNPWYGLKQFGPYDKSKAESIKIATIVPKTNENQVNGLINDLTNGTSGFESGYPRYFGCKIEIIKKIIIDTAELSDYQKACEDLVSVCDPKDVGLVLIYIPKTEKWEIQSPYYRCKNILASNGYVSQMVTEKLFDNLYWSYFNIASAMFAKSGYIPWVLKSNYNVDLVIGISYSYIIPKNKTESSTKFVGFVNLFDKYGKWMYMDGSLKVYSKQDIRIHLKEIVNASIQKYESYKQTSPNKIMIHYYKKFSQKEREAIFESIKESYPTLKIILCSIDDSHNYKLFDNRTNDGSFPRGGYAKIFTDAYLLDTTGDTPISKKRMGTPKLLLIRLFSNYQRSDEEDMDILYYILGLTKLDWGTVTPSFVREPLSLQYSKALAYLTSAMNEDEWNKLMDKESPVNPVINKKPWFI